VTTIDKTGPFFKNDPGKTFRANAQDLMDETLEQGKSDAIAQLRAGEPNRRPVRIASPNRVSGHVIAEKRQKARKPTELTGVVKVDNSGSVRQAIAIMAAASEIESRSKPFSRTAARLRAANKFNAPELLKGIS